MFESLAHLGHTLYLKSAIEKDGTAYALARAPQGKALVIQGDAAGFTGETQADVTLCPLTAANAAALRARLPWLRPQPLGLRTSAGCGDRLGLATPGHIRAVRAVGGDIAPILAQQSMRENARTRRTPQQVMDDALWGVFQEGWQAPWGADADHLKTTDDVDDCVAAGYTFFTIDPGAHVDNAAHTDGLETLRGKFAALPWDALEDSAEAMRARYLGSAQPIEDFTLTFDEATLLRAACKYGRAIAHTVKMARHLKAAKDGISVEGTPSPNSQLLTPNFDLEISVDETDTPTSPLEHIFIVRELRRLGVTWVSLAPRYVGRFEKGVDYIGDLAEFEAEFAKHAAIARALGPYKLSIHSGSDKFSVYPIVAKHTRRLAHLKTAGTSYLEALRAIAGVDPALFREILGLAIKRYDVDRATYHVSADIDNVLMPSLIPDEELADVLDTFDGREALHVTFGSALDRFGERLLATLDANEEAHYAALERHFIRHLTPFK